MPVNNFQNFNAPTTKDRMIATLAEFGDWEVIEGGEDQTTYEEYPELGQFHHTYLRGIGRYNDITLERAFNPGPDFNCADWVRDYLFGSEKPRVLMKKYLNVDGRVITTENFLVKPVSLKTPGGKSGDGSIGMTTLLLKIEERRLG